MVTYIMKEFYRFDKFAFQYIKSFSIFKDQLNIKDQPK